MKKAILTLTLFAGTMFNAGAQTATDFTANDCNGNSHNLFAELDAGKVIVIVWVMPCGSCITNALEAYAVAESYASSNPGKVVYYLVDDYGNTTCSTLNAWADSYSMTNATRYSNAAINMADYGTPGMPKVAVLSGPDHQVYYNQNSSTSGLQTAVDLAISENNAGIPEAKNEGILNFYPNPATEKLIIELDGALETIELFDVNGNKIAADLYSVNSTLNEMNLDVKALVNGTYIVKIHTNNATKTGRFVVSN